MRRCGLTTTSVDNIINDLAATTTVAGTLNLSNDGVTNGNLNLPRSAASDTGYNTLISLGWNITLVP
jgi:hypothetical protein